MPVTLDIRNESVRKRLIRRDRLVRLAERICAGEAMDGNAEISLLLCDDHDIAKLNTQFRDHRGPTDVLSFEQPEAPVPAGHARALGDIVISVETAARNCGGDGAALRAEIEMLFCHGLLHLLGYDHHTARERAQMQRKQAAYLNLSLDAAWQFGPKTADAATKRTPADRGRAQRVG